MTNVSKKRVYDDFTKIKGIGESTQQWLREKFAAYYYSDLAKLNLDDLEQSLKDSGKIASRSRIEQWLTQAGEFASLAPSANPSAEEASGSVLWRTIATFVVVFEESSLQEGKSQTKVHHMEADHTQSWNRVETKIVCDWISQELKDKLTISERVIETAALEAKPQFVIENSSGHNVEISTAKSIATQQAPKRKSDELLLNEAGPNHSAKLQAYIRKSQALTRTSE
jgi:hypothetical protein